MKYIGVTRFNNETFDEYYTFINNTRLHTCDSVINCPVKINEKVILDSFVYVLEMNNTENKIMGITCIKNRQYRNQKINIYKHLPYNRYSYLGVKRIDRNDFDQKTKQIINFFEIICFKGKKHLKRGLGIQIISEQVIKKTNKIINLIEYFNDIFNKDETK